MLIILLTYLMNLHNINFLSEEKLLFVYDESPQVTGIAAIGFDGQIERFSSINVDRHQISVAPDGDYVTFLDFEGNLYLYDTDGTLLNQYQFDKTQGEDCQEWSLWGMIGVDTVVISHCLQKVLTFYEFEFGGSQLREMDNINQLIENVLSPILLFSPDFSYVFTPHNFQENIEINETAYIYDLTVSSTPKIAEMTGVYPWWQVNRFKPEWASNNNLIYPVFDGSTYDLYLFTPDKAESKLVFDATCDDCFGPSKIEINPLSDQTAFWHNGNLLTLDLESGETSKLVELEAFIVSIAWSRTDNYLAIILNEQTSSPQLIIFDISSGKIRLTKQLSGYTNPALIGFVTIPK